VLWAKSGIIGYILIAGMITGVMMIAYLSSERMHRLMGKYYLPAAFIVATLETAILEMLLRQRVITDNADYLRTISDLTASSRVLSPFVTNLAFEAWRVSPPLFFLLIFVSWQYSMREVTLFAFSVALIELLFPIRIGISLESQMLFTLTIIFVRTLAFLMMGFLVTQLVGAQRKQRHELAEARAKVAHYATMVESLAISRERNRMARELHDTLAHTLSAASVQLEAVNSLWDANREKSHTVLQQALDTTRSGLTETRRALQSLRAAPLEDLGLVLALRELAEATEKRTGSNIHLTLPDQLEDLPYEVEQTTYRIAQEALENIARHAQAQNVDIRLTRANGSISLEICDDGVGFDMDKIDFIHHFGLRGMFERVSAMGGELDVESRPNEGTKARLTLGV
jgi:signal transduction histidine kinase